MESRNSYIPEAVAKRESPQIPGGVAARQEPTAATTIYTHCLLTALHGTQLS